MTAYCAFSKSAQCEVISIILFKGNIVKSFFIKVTLQDQRVDEFEKVLEDLKKSGDDVTVYRVPVRSGNRFPIKLILKRGDGDRFEYKAASLSVGDNGITANNVKLFPPFTPASKADNE